MILPLAFIEGIGGPELMMILFIVLLMFGANKLPELARGLGKSMKEFKKAAADVEHSFKEAMDEKPAESGEARRFAPKPVTPIDPKPNLIRPRPPAAENPPPPNPAPSVPPAPSTPAAPTTPPPPGAPPA